MISIDLVGGKVVRKMAPVERPESPNEQETSGDSSSVLGETSGNPIRGSGAFSKNPLLSGLIKPVFDAKGKGNAQEGRRANAMKWRRVQDELDNNEDLILDGGIYGQVDGPQGT